MRKCDSSNQVEDYISLLWQSEFQFGKAMWSGWWLPCHCFCVPSKVILFAAAQATGSREQECGIRHLLSKAQPGNSTSHFHRFHGRGWGHMTMLQGKQRIVVQPPASAIHSSTYREGKTVRDFHHREVLSYWGLQTTKLRHRMIRKLLQEQCGTGISTHVIWLYVALNHYAPWDL